MFSKNFHLLFRLLRNIFLERFLSDRLFGYLFYRKLLFFNNRTSQFLHISSRSQVLGNVDVLKDYAKFFPALESIFDKAADFQSPVCNFIKKETPAFPYAFCQSFKNTFVIEQLPATLTFLNYDF